MRKRRNSISHTDLRTPDILTGLTAEDVRIRTEAGFVNRSAVPKTKSVPRILFEHLFTLFNLINLLMAAALLIVHSTKNMLFFGVVLCNAFIGLWQELRAKRTTDKLAILASSTVTVRRDGQEVRIPSESLVFGDIVLLRPGDQIPADCTLIYGDCEVSEALLTGESEPVEKSAGETLLSGSFLVAGECVATAIRVGETGLLQEIAAGAKQYRRKTSQIIRALKRIIDALTLLFIPYAILFFWLQTRRVPDVPAAVRNTVAAMVGMIPEGLILLISGMMALAVYRLSKKRMLVKELYSVETLARTDTLCFDKTGTLTDGKLAVANILSFDTEQEALLHALALISGNVGGNETAEAIARHCGGQDVPSADEILPFSSKRKYSAVYFADGSAYILGAPEVLLTPSEQEQRLTADMLAAECRVLCVSVAENASLADPLPEKRRALGLVLLTDTIRPGAVDTVAFFQQQGVRIKLISGDHPVTVARIARGAGVPEYDKYLDLSTVPESADYAALAETYTIFGRATPVQKQLLVRAMREDGHTVAMTGDGVNDVLAMREADCAIAINDGTDAARNVADIVMLDSDYASLPDAVAEGRSAVNNLERSASLFLIKTIYSVLLGILFLFLPGAYPFVPIQLTLINSLTVAIPSLFFSLRPSKQRIRGNFLTNALARALPAGIAVAIGVVAASLLGRFYPIPQEDISTVCCLCTAVCAVCGLLWVLQPLDRLKITVITAVSAVYLLCVFCFRDLFEMQLSRFSSSLVGTAALAFALAAFLLTVLLQNGYTRLHLEKYVVRLLTVIRYFSRKMSAHRVGACSAQVAYFMLFATVPLLILLLSLTTLLSLSAEELIGGLSRIFPSLVGGLFDDIIRSIFENGSSAVTSFSIIAVVWAASKSVYYIIGGLNSVFEIKESRSMFRLRALSIFYTLAFVLILVATLVLMVFGTFIAGILLTRFPNLEGLVNALSSLRFVIGLLLLTFFFALLFKVLPDRTISFTSQLPGAVIAAVGWVLFSFIFSFYVNNFANYANVYGSLAAIIVYMLWLYICMFILFFGAELNLLIEKSTE